MLAVIFEGAYIQGVSWGRAFYDVTTKGRFEFGLWMFMVVVVSLGMLVVASTIKSN